MSRMLYKHPGQHPLHGDMFDYIVVDELEVDKHIESGWSMTTDEAKNLDVIDADIDDEPTRKEIEAKADELGVSYRANTKDETILKKIEEALDELD